MPPQPSLTVGGGPYGEQSLQMSSAFFHLLEDEFSKASFDASVSVLPIPRETRSRVSVSIIVERQN